MPAARPFRRMLVGWDASADAVAALRAATAIADEEGHVVALAVLPPGGHAETEQERSADADAARGRVRSPFERLHAELAGPGSCRITLQFAADRHIHRALCRYAAEHGFDMLVLGRRGNGGAGVGKLGHVADAVVRAGTVPVLLTSAP